MRGHARKNSGISSTVKGDVFGIVIAIIPHPLGVGSVDVEEIVVQSTARFEYFGDDGDTMEPYANLQNSPPPFENAEAAFDCGTHGDGEGGREGVGGVTFESALKMP